MHGCWFIQKNDVDKSQASFGSLKEHLINKRQDRLSNVVASVQCMKSVTDSKALNLRSKTEMQGIRSRLEVFCQSSVEGFQEARDDLVVCGNNLNKQSASIGGEITHALL